MGFVGAYGLCVVKCASSNGKGPNSLDNGVKKVERLLEEKRRAELSARIASGEFTVEKTGYTIICVLFFIFFISFFLSSGWGLNELVLNHGSFSLDFVCYC